MVYPEYKQIQVFILNKDEKYGKPVIYENGENISSVVLTGLSISTDDIFKL